MIWAIVIATLLSTPLIITHTMKLQAARVSFSTQDCAGQFQHVALSASPRLSCDCATSYKQVFKPEDPKTLNPVYYIPDSIS